MGKLLKYEFCKSWAVKLIALGIFGVLEAIYLIGITLRDEETSAVAAFLLFFATMFVPMIVGIASVVSLHRDMTAKQGYMLFMTPRNCFQILGAKVLENGISLFAAGGIIMALGFLDVSLLFSRFGMAGSLWETFSQVIHGILGMEINAQAVCTFFFTLLCSWVCEVCMAYFADILAASLLRGKKFSGLLAFVFFILISILVARLNTWITSAMNLQQNSRLLAGALFSLICAVWLYFGAAAVMERSLNV